MSKRGYNDFAVFYLSPPFHVFDILYVFTFFVNYLLVFMLCDRIAQGGGDGIEED